MTGGERYTYTITTDRAEALQLAKDILVMLYDEDGREFSYNHLLRILAELDDVHIHDDVTVYDAVEDEFYPLVGTKFATSETDDMLDAGHPYIVFDKSFISES